MRKDLGDKMDRWELGDALQVEYRNDTLGESGIAFVERRFKVIDLADLSDSVMIHGPGQSGHPMHRNYDGGATSYRNGETRPTKWARDDAAAGSRRVLLVPGAATASTAVDPATER